MNPSSPSNPGMLDNLMNFLFGQKALGQAGGTPTSPGAALPAGFQQGNSQIFSDPSQNNTQMQGIVNAYMQQKALADSAKKRKKKPVQPVLED